MEMKELKALEPVYLEKYDIKVNPYLTYTQIQQIVNAVMELDMWAAREESIDMLTLYHATDLGKEAIEETGHNMFVESGAMSDVRNSIINFYEIYDALEYTTSVQRSLTQIIKQLPELVKKYGNPIKK